MGRREFIAGLGGTAVYPLAARGQPNGPVIGFLSARSAGESATLVDAFRQGLAQSGHIDGSNVMIEYRWAEGSYDRLPALASELVNRRVAVLAAVGGNIAALPAKAATTTIPVVFVVGTDPVKDGLVASFNRPGGNVTGATLYSSVLAGKRLELLHLLMPSTRIVAALVNPANLSTSKVVSDLEAAAVALGLELHLLRASTESEIDEAFAVLAKQQVVRPLFVQSEAFFNARREQLIALAARHRIVACYDFREFVPAGGLMSYGASFTEVYRQAGVYSAKILNGAKPAELPVVQPTKFEFLINLRTAKSLGLTIPETLLATADEVIQ